jgi:signal transduction histidine kinase
MNLHFSISLKLTIIAVAVSAAVIFSLTIYNINEQAISFENIYVEKARDIASIFDISYFSNDGREDINSTLKQFNASNNDLSKMNIYLKKNKSIILTYSTDDINTDLFYPYYLNLSIENHIQIKINEGTADNQKLIIITPINVTSNIAGAYQFFFSIDKSIQAFQSKTTNLLLISVMSLFVLIFGFLYLLRHTIVKPIINFRDSALKYGKGSFDTRVKINSKDEIGELAQAFNTMAHDLKISRDKIEEYNKILERLLDQKDAFIGQLGHDLKNPLQSLVGLLPIIIQQEENPKIKEHLKILDQDTKYMKELIFKTLELAKLRSEKIEFDFKDINLHDLVKDIVSSQKIILGHNISLSFNIPEDMMVYADKLRLEEVIKNLISNAVKYSSENLNSIIISASQEKYEVKVSIKDTGIGMKKDQIEKVFDEFYRAASTTKDTKSMGLGLSICKKIIEKHHGRIWAESKGVDKGSVFYFTLKKAKDKI